MNCIGCQELLTDHIEGALAAPLEAELKRHLASCQDCSTLLASVTEVVDVLSRAEVPDPPSDLTDRILARTLPRLQTSAEAAARRPGLLPSGWPWAASWLAAAAVFVFVFLWRPPELLSEWSREVSKSARQVYSFGVRTANDAERWLTELNVLRMTVGVAFEDRLDRLTERLRDLEELRRGTDNEEADPSSSRTSSRDVLAHRISSSKRSLV